MSEEEIYEQATKCVQAKRGFYRHLFTYIPVNIILVLVWAFPAGGGIPGCYELSGDGVLP
ncbi:MAG: 2TM domain-containing protein [Dehalococcoidales bacterium]|nr:MAG: 2TM domain-containing protein [Dehalococcoidales bacterium]